MTCEHKNVSLPTASGWETVCADCGMVLDPAPQSLPLPAPADPEP